MHYWLHSTNQPIVPMIRPTPSRKQDPRYLNSSTWGSNLLPTRPSLDPHLNMWGSMSVSVTLEEVLSRSLAPGWLAICKLEEGNGGPLLEAGLGEDLLDGHLVARIWSMRLSRAHLRGPSPFGHSTCKETIMRPVQCTMGGIYFEDDDDYMIILW